MNRLHAWSSHVVTAIVSVSGLTFLWMKYALVNDDPFSVVNHPLQPLMLNLHVLTAPLLVFLFGLVFESHIQKKLKAGPPLNRRSGLIALVTFAVMTLSGYALQVSSAPGIARAALLLHISSSMIFVVSYLMHQVVTFRLWRAREA